MEIFLFPIIGFVIFAIVSFSIASARRKSAAEQQRNHSERTIGESAQTNAPVRPSDRYKPVPAKNKSQIRQHAQEPLKTVHAEAKPAMTQKQEVQLNKPILAFSGSDAVKGILYAEILGKPKALRRP